MILIHNIFTNEKTHTINFIGSNPSWLSFE